MKYHILLGILLWTAVAALAQNTAPAADSSLTPHGKPSAPGLKEPSPSHGKSGKPAAPLSKPEFGEEDEIQNDYEEDEADAECDGCLLAGRMQTPITYVVAEMNAVTGLS
ncbi:MAG: hypothetical protein ABIW76_07530 [Fibrobacteria bacterium]